MKLKIVQAGEPVLRERGRALTKDEIKSPEVQRLIELMRDTMHEAPGVGLAAPQVGVSIQLAVIEDQPEYLAHHSAEELAALQRSAVPFHVIINPKLTLLGDESAQFFEGCLRAQENERLKLGRELHDSTGQLLLALRLEIARLREVYGTSVQGPLLDEIDETVREIDREIRAFSFTHYPAEVGGEGLGPALRSLARGFASRTGLKINFSSIPNSIAQTGQVALALLRVAQEALLNVHRHAHALHVQMALTLRGGMLELTVRDDGVGIPQERDLEESHGVGLLGMRHRVEGLGGNFAIRRLKQGTKIVATVPA